MYLTTTVTTLKYTNQEFDTLFEGDMDMEMMIVRSHYMLVAVVLNVAVV